MGFTCSDASGASGSAQRGIHKPAVGAYTLATLEAIALRLRRKSCSNSRAEQVPPHREGEDEDAYMLSGSHRYRGDSSGFHTGPATRIRQLQQANPQCEQVPVGTCKGVSLTPHVGTALPFLLFGGGGWVRAGGGPLRDPVELLHGPKYYSLTPYFCGKRRGGLGGGELLLSATSSKGLLRKIVVQALSRRRSPSGLVHALQLR